MSTSRTAQPLRSRTFDYSVVALGLLWALASTASSLTSAGELPWGYWLAAPVAALIVRYPMTLFARSASVQIGFDSCVIAFLGTLLDTSSAMMVWSAGIAISFLTSRVRRSARIFNFGVGLVAGGTGLWVIAIARGPVRETSARELAAVGAGCAVVFLVDYLLSEISVALEEAVPVATQLFSTDMAVALAGVVTVDSVGYLGALVVRELPYWCIALLIVPVAALLAATVARDIGIESSRRMRVLFSAATRIHGLETRDAVLGEVETTLRELARGNAEVTLRDSPPQRKEIGAPFDDGESRRWLVTRRLWRARRIPTLDSQHLNSLARIGSDALNRVRMNDTVTRLAERDPLTGLYNRSVFLRRVDEALARCRGTTKRVAVLFCDLDGFKTVNDWFGHAVGDELLVDVARSLEEALGADAVVARLGGDEFAVLLQGIAGGQDLEPLTATVLVAVERRFESSGRFAMVSASVGLAQSDGRHTADQLIRNADIAMYHAKFAGKNRAQEYHPSLGRARVRSLELAEALSRALDERALAVAYQGVANAVTGRIMGVEALARWTHEGRAVPPDVFIPLAEERGLIEPLGELVLEMVTADAARLETAADWPLTIGVNVSALQLHSPNFVTAVRRARTGMGSVALVLELTERQVVGDDAAVGRALKTLQSDGVRLALDDFGVGFSSIGYLQTLAVQILKIDRQFCVDIDSDARRMRLLLSMIDMGQAMGLDVVVEGVERQAQIDALAPHLGGFAEHVHLQGYLLGRPTGLEETIRRIAASASPGGAGPPEPDLWPQLRTAGSGLLSQGELRVALSD